jgi:carboxyl-terminal processing protease
MTLRIRALIAALIVVAVAAAGTFYIRQRAVAVAGPRGVDVATNGGLADVLAQPPPDGPELARMAVRDLQEVYYKPVDADVVLKGESDSLRDFLRTKHVANATLANDAAGSDEDRAAETLTGAQDRYAATLGPEGRNLLSEAALRGIMSSMNDPYTVFLSAREIQGLNESLSGGNFGGIGVYIYQLKDGRVLVQPIQEMPAARAGMKPGEVVDTVDGTVVRGLALDRVEQLIRGVTGSTVRITAHQYNAPKAERTFSVTREIIHVPSVRAKMEDGYDYIRLSDFGQTSAEEVRKALVDGEQHHAKGYIFDLRDNGGGLVTAATQISSLFVPQGPIVSTIQRDGQKTTDSALGDQLPGLQPVVVLVNKYTASASEITAGALQDYHLATILGTKTFGKGVVQTIIPLGGENAPLGAFKITTARYVTPLGRDIQHRGITPDVIVNQSVDPALIDTPNDKQLAAAKAKLRALSQR